MFSLKDKRILIILPSLKMGGAERQAVLFADYLVRQQRAHVHILGIGRPASATQFCEEHNIPWDSIYVDWPPNKLRRLKGVFQFSQKLSIYKPDIILSYSMFPNLLGGLAWRLTGAKLFVWNQRDEGRHFKGTRFEQLAIKLTPRYLSNSYHGKDFLVKELNAIPDKVTVVYNGVELQPPLADRTVWRQRLAIDEDCFLACMVANLHHFKDQATLLRAWRHVIDHLNRPAVLLLAGRFDTTHDSLKALAYDLELGKTVRFLGKVDDISGLLSAVDLGVFSSMYEGCPNGVLECMAAGLAVIGTDIPGIREAVGPNNYHLLTPPEDNELLAQKIIELSETPQLRNQIGLANRHRIKQLFDPITRYYETANLLKQWLK